MLLLAAGVVVRAEAVRVDSAGCALSTGAQAAADVFERPYGRAHDLCAQPSVLPKPRKHNVPGFCEIWVFDLRSLSRVFACVDWPRGFPNTPFEVRFCGLVSLLAFRASLKKVG